MKMNNEAYGQVKGLKIDKYKRMQVNKSGCALCRKRAGAWIVVEVGVVEWKMTLSSFKNIQNRDNESNQGA